MIKVIFIVVISTLISACAFPTETLSKVNSDLKGICQQMFLRVSIGEGYGQNAYQYSPGRRAFAIGQHGDIQYCNHASGGWATTTQEQVNEHAIKSCSNNPPKINCVLYAIGDEVVYDKNSHQRLIANQEEIDKAVARRKAEEMERQRSVEAEKFANMRRIEEENAARNAQRLASEKESAARAQSNALEQIEKMCVELGFRKSTEAYGKCVLQLLDREQKNIPKEASAEKLNRVDGTSTRGDGSPDDSKCREFGYQAGSQPYADCRLKMNSLRVQAEERQRDYEQRQREYDAKVAEYERQRKIASSLALVQCGLNMVAGNNCVGGRVGPAPVPPSPVSPVIQNIILPGGRIVNCTTIGMNTSCR
jgi:hypothetical protein